MHDSFMQFMIFLSPFRHTLKTKITLKNLLKGINDRVIVTLTSFSLNLRDTMEVKRVKIFRLKETEDRTKG